MKKYYSKLLLFGEYSTIIGSQALAVPYSQYFAEWRSHDHTPEGERSNQSLKAYAAWLEQQTDVNEIIDIQKLKRDLNSGFYLHSTIPQGYGAGSSGAVCAAIYDEYGVDQTNLSIVDLKARLGTLEGYFHGASSGTDPLVCYLNEGILIGGSEKISIVNVPEYSKANGALFLLDTQHSRETSPLVQLFLKKCKDSIYQNKCKTTLSPLAQSCISAYLRKDKTGFNEHLRDLSVFQYNYFKEMIPEAYHTIWQQGLEKGNFYLKLCGAGGGGFIMGFCPDFEQTKSDLDAFLIQKVHDF